MMSCDGFLGCCGLLVCTLVVISLKTQTDRQIDKAADSQLAADEKFNGLSYPRALSSGDFLISFFAVLLGLDQTLASRELDAVSLFTVIIFARKDTSSQLRAKERFAQVQL